MWISQGKQNSYMGYYEIWGAFGGENFNANQASFRRKGARNWDRKIRNTCYEQSRRVN